MEVVQCRLTVAAVVEVRFSHNENMTQRGNSGYAATMDSVAAVIRKVVAEIYTLSGSVDGKSDGHVKGNLESGRGIGRNTILKDPAGHLIGRSGIDASLSITLTNINPQPGKVQDFLLDGVLVKQCRFYPSLAAKKSKLAFGTHLHLTRRKAIEHEKPVMHLDLMVLSIDDAVTTLQQFIKTNQLDVLNIAGSRASKDEEIYGAVFEVLCGVL